MLDPGHGGIDAGTLGTANTAEKDVVLRFAKLLRDKLRATGRFDVHMTREIDVFVKLDERVRMARARGCDLFISLHTDLVPAQYAHLNVRGATIYTMSAQDGDARAQKLAEKENLSDVIAGVETLQDEEPEVAGILTDLMRRETTNSTTCVHRHVDGLHEEIDRPRAANPTAMPLSRCCAPPTCRPFL